MKKIIITLCGILVVFGVFAQNIPQEISYQGKLLENGTPVNGVKNITFTIGYWTETRSVAVTNGLYSVTLGEINPIPISLFNNSSGIKLQISVEGIELSPQTDILSVPFAFNAEMAADAAKLDGQTPSYYNDWNNLYNIPPDILVGGITLPYSDTYDGDSCAFQITNSGTNKLTDFRITNKDNESAVLIAETNGLGSVAKFKINREEPYDFKDTNSVILAETNSYGSAAEFRNKNYYNEKPTILAENGGYGGAAEFIVSGMRGAEPALKVHTKSPESSAAKFSKLYHDDRFHFIHFLRGGNAFESFSQGGIKVETSRRDGITVKAKDDGINVEASSGDGINVKAFEGTGINVEASRGDGIKVEASRGDGINVKAFKGTGINVTATVGYGLKSNSKYGIKVRASGGGYGAIISGGPVSIENSSGVGLDVSGIAIFKNNVAVYGTLTKGAGSFMIDHPLDPEHKYLYHSFVESPDMMNVYNGNIELDENGEAIVELPNWFETLNRDFRYQLTCIGSFAPVYVAEEISGNTFKIAGGKSGIIISWQVTGIRQDPYANHNRVQVEVDKTEEERGHYLHYEEYNQPIEKSISSLTDPEATEKNIRKEDAP